jgi:hypothetical protein
MKTETTLAIVGFLLLGAAFVWMCLTMTPELLQQMGGR